jgi:hypothetical protein
VFGSLEAVLDKAFLVLIEREWVVIMSQVAANNVDDTAAAAAGDTTTVVATASAAVGEPNRTSWLSETNVVMKQISLGCQVVAPAVTVFVSASLIVLVRAAATAVPRQLVAAMMLTAMPMVTCRWLRFWWRPLMLLRSL